MECNVTSTKRRRTSGFTLVEFLVALGLTGIVLTAIAQLTFYTGRSFAALLNYTELDKYSRNALDQMVYKIRQADELDSYSPTHLAFTYGGTNTLVYDYSPSAHILT